MSQRTIAALEQFGFSNYEARAYVGLLKQNPITGYQLSKVCGVPRSRIYETLERLEARGYAAALQTDPVSYSPLGIPELLGHLQEQFDGALSTLDQELRQLATAPSTESIWNLRGREDILRRARAMIANAQESVYLVGWGETLQALRPELESIDQQNIRVVVIHCGESDLDVGIHYRHAFEQDLVHSCDSSLDLVVDGREVLIGETQPAETCQAAWSTSPALVTITEEYIRHEVYLHKIIARFGETLATELRAALAEGLGEVPHTHLMNVNQEDAQ